MQTVQRSECGTGLTFHDPSDPPKDILHGPGCSLCQGLANSMQQLAMAEHGFKDIALELPESAIPRVYQNLMLARHRLAAHLATYQVEQVTEEALAGSPALLEALRPYYDDVKTLIAVISFIIYLLSTTQNGESTTVHIEDLHIEIQVQQDDSS